MPARSIHTAVEFYVLPDTTTREEASVNVRTLWVGDHYEVIVSAYQVHGSEAVMDVDQVIGTLYRNTALPQSREWVLTLHEGPVHLHGRPASRACPTLGGALGVAAKMYARGLLLDARQDAREAAEPKPVGVRFVQDSEDRFWFDLANGWQRGYVQQSSVSNLWYANLPRLTEDGGTRVTGGFPTKEEAADNLDLLMAPLEQPKPAPTSQDDAAATRLVQEHVAHLRLLAKTLDGAEFFTREEPARIVIDGEGTVTKHYYRFPGDTEDSEGYGTAVGAYWSARHRAEILALTEEVKA